MFSRKNARSFSAYLRPFFGGIGCWGFAIRGGGGGTKATPAVLETAGVVATVPGYCFNFDCVTFLLAADFDFAFLAIAGLFFDVDAEADVAVFPELSASRGSSRVKLFFLPQPS
jgi:hypothetical protein